MKQRHDPYLLLVLQAGLYTLAFSACAPFAWYGGIILGTVLRHPAMVTQWF